MILSLIAGPRPSGLAFPIKAAVGEGLGDRVAVHRGLPAEIGNRARHPQHPFAGPGTEGPVLQGGAPELQGIRGKGAATGQVFGTQAAVGAAARVASGHALPGQPDPFRHLGRGFC